MPQFTDVLERVAYGAAIRFIRKQKRVRQGELAQLAGIKQPNLSRLENGLVTPRDATVRRIALALGVPPETFTSPEVRKAYATSHLDVSLVVFKEVVKSCPRCHARVLKILQGDANVDSLGDGTHQQ